MAGLFYSKQTGFRSVFKQSLGLVRQLKSLHSNRDNETTETSLSSSSVIATKNPSLCALLYYWWNSPQSAFSTKLTQTLTCYFSKVRTKIILTLPYIFFHWIDVISERWMIRKPIRELKLTIGIRFREPHVICCEKFLSYTSASVLSCLTRRPFKKDI